MGYGGRACVGLGVEKLYKAGKASPVAAAPVEPAKCLMQINVKPALICSALIYVLASS